MPTPKQQRRQALELLKASIDGCTEAIIRSGSAAPPMNSHRAAVHKQGPAMFFRPWFSVCGTRSASRPHPNRPGNAEATGAQGRSILCCITLMCCRRTAVTGSRNLSARSASSRYLAASVIKYSATLGLVRSFARLTARLAVGGLRKSAFPNDDCRRRFPQPKPREAV
jgi:hypothetical protein